MRAEPGAALTLVEYLFAACVGIGLACVFIPLIQWLSNRRRQP
jgi:hypothetical protein